MNIEFSWTLLLLPFIAATIGWFTNFIAVKMLFHPKEPINFLGFKIHGIFPKRQKDIAVSVGKMVANDLLNVEDLQDKLANKENVLAIIDKIENTLDQPFIAFDIKVNGNLKNDSEIIMSSSSINNERVFNYGEPYILEYEEKKLIQDIHFDNINSWSSQLQFLSKDIKEWMLYINYIYLVYFILRNTAVAQT